MLLLLSAAPLVLQESLQVPDMEDVVTCTDGTEIRGTVLCVGPRRVIVLVDEQEIELLPSKIASICKVKVPGGLTSYTAENVDGTLKIVGRATGVSEESAPPPPRSAEKKEPSEKKRGKDAPAAKKEDRVRRKITELLKKYGEIKKLEKVRKNAKLKKMIERNTDLLKSREVKKLLESLSE